jgi:hypothetical protein
MTMISMDDMVKSRDGNHVKVESEIHLSRPSFISRYIDGQGSLDSSLAGKKPPLETVDIAGEIDQEPTSKSLTEQGKEKALNTQHSRCL